MADPTRQKLLEVGKKLLQERKSRAATPAILAAHPSPTVSSPTPQLKIQPTPLSQQQNNDELIKLNFKISAQSHSIEELINENLHLQEKLKNSDSERYKARCAFLEQQNQELTAQLAAQQEDDKAALISSLQTELMNEKEQHSRAQIELTRLTEKTQQKQLALDLQLEKQASSIETLTEQKITIRKQLQDQIDKLLEERARLEDDLKIRSQQAKEYYQLQQQMELTVREKDLELSAIQNELRRYQHGQEQLLESEAKREAGVRQSDEEKMETIARLQKKIEEDLVEKQALIEDLKLVRAKLRDSENLRESGKKTILEQAELLSMMQMETEKKQRENRETHEKDTLLIQKLMEEKEKLMIVYEEKLCAVRAENTQKLKDFKLLEEQLVSEVERASSRAAKEREILVAQCEDLRQQNLQLRASLLETDSQSHSSSNSLAQSQSQHITNQQELEEYTTKIIQLQARETELIQQVDSAKLIIVEKEEIINRLTHEKEELLRINERNEQDQKQKDKIRYQVSQEKSQEGGSVALQKSEEEEEEEEIENESTLEALQERRIYQLLEEIQQLKDQNQHLPRNRAMSDGESGRLRFNLRNQIQKLSESNEALEKELLSQTRKNSLLLHEIFLLRRRLNSMPLADNPSYEYAGKRATGDDDLGGWLSFFPILGHLVSRKNFENTCELIV